MIAVRTVVATTNPAPISSSGNRSQVAACGTEHQAGEDVARADGGEARDNQGPRLEAGDQEACDRPGHDERHDERPMATDREDDAIAERDVEEERQLEERRGLGEPDHDADRDGDGHRGGGPMRAAAATSRGTAAGPTRS